MRKPLDQLSPAYRKRVESGLQRGLTRSQSRGHAGVYQAPAYIIRDSKRSHGHLAQEIVRIARDLKSDPDFVEQLSNDYDPKEWFGDLKSNFKNAFQTKKGKRTRVNTELGETAFNDLNAQIRYWQEEIEGMEFQPTRRKGEKRSTNPLKRTGHEKYMH